MYRNFLYKSLLLSVIIFIGSETAYSQPCDNKIKPVDSYKIAYRNRGNRCEGFYRSKVAAKSIEIVGVVKGSFNFRLKKNEVLEISSTFIKDRPINVRAEGIPIKTYYRMDAIIAPGKILIWPIADVIYSQRLSTKKIGIYGWVVKEGEKIYVPVSVVAKMVSLHQDEKIRLYLRTSVDVESVKWRTSYVIGNACSQFGKWKNTSKPYYRTGQPIRITLLPGEKEKLCVEVAAKEKRGARWLKRSARVIVKEGIED